MSNATLISPQSMMDTMSIHTEIAKGAIKVASNPRDFGVATPSFSELMQQKSPRSTATKTTPLR